jgi:CBS domain-containing protein
MMVNGHLHRVLVTNDTGVLGIVTSLDLVRLLVDEEV